jgi:hypothetical protein
MAEPTGLLINNGCSDFAGLEDNIWSLKDAFGALVYRLRVCHEDGVPSCRVPCTLNNDRHVLVGPQVQHMDLGAKARSRSGPAQPLY